MDKTTPVHKTFGIEVVTATKSGGRIIINTASVDRDRDRVLPGGCRAENYLKNPVVQWGHEYRAPWSTIGKTTSMTIEADRIMAEFELRPAANDQDPQNIIRLLWEGGWVRTASIGFIPKVGKQNDLGGYDFSEWELLEWSLVPIPANQDALRLAVKSMDDPEGVSIIKAPCAQCGQQTDFSATLFALSQSDMQPLKCMKCISDTQAAKSADENSRAWMRKLTVETGAGEQTVFAAFTHQTVDVPEDATLLQFDFQLGECTEVPHPDAGKSVKFKTVMFVPPIEVRDFVDYVDDVLYSRTLRERPDEQMLVTEKYWTVREWSAILESIPLAKAFGGRAVADFGIETLTQRSIDRATKWAKALQRKRGRVLSAKNEDLLRGAQQDIDAAKEKIDTVLEQIDGQQPNDEPDDGTKSGQVMVVTEPQKSADAAPVQATDPRMLAGDDGADAAAAAERELAETLRAYFKTVKEVLA